MAVQEPDAAMLAGIKVAMIAAMASNRVIGRDNQLPWHIPEDLKFFKRVTLGKPVVMGRNTFESIGRPLPGRTNIVVTRNRNWSAEGVEVVASLEAALESGERAARAAGADEVMVIGGGEIYRQALPLAQRLYLTEVQAEFQGDAWFPEIGSGWEEQWRESHPATDSGQPGYDFACLERL
ncbi:dihydrofolate reductase [Biformimicrobium ophioploci]|uniref:Dihydrofolate reductase n=1 Tax=Biformimicrobium ophioploci TaxID=3036711 RepID=A0ABQ6M0K2_9GAMM|nr:dihydrofolate reductase [Microbulbifer sp. NKW57]GMG87857.1 type 3 dihydrofolate reductase [Microbulbifer sp. NKW57]